MAYPPNDKGVISTSIVRSSCKEQATMSQFMIHPNCSILYHSIHLIWVGSLTTVNTKFGVLTYFTKLR